MMAHNSKIRVIRLIDALGRRVMINGIGGVLSVTEKPGVYAVVGIGGKSFLTFDERRLACVTECYGEIAVALA